METKQQNWVAEVKELPSNGANDKDKLGVFEEFTQNATVHGLRHTYGTGRSRFRRGFWLFAFLGMIGVLLYTVIAQLILVRTYPTISKQSINVRDTMLFPAVTLCNLNKIRKSAVPDEATRQLLLAMSDIGSITTPNLNDSIWANQTKFNTIEFREYAEDIAHPLKLTLKNCKWDNKPYLCDELFVSRITDFGLCYTFNARETKNSSQRIALHEGNKYGLTVVANIMHEEYVLSADTDVAGLRVVLHDFDETPLVEGRGFDVGPGFATKGSLKMKHLTSLPPPYTSVHGIECTDTSSEQFTNFLQFYKHYDIGVCVMECRYKYIVDFCNCQAIFDVGTATVCNATTLLGCYFPRFEQFMAENRHIYCECPIPCVMNIYDAAVSVASYPSKPLMQQTNELYNISVDEDTFRSNYLKLTLAYDNFMLETIEQLPQYTFESTMSALGGQLGIYLGASLLSLLEFMELGLDLLTYSVFRGRKKEIPNG